MTGIKVVSLFDGMACGLVALKRAGIKVDKYIAYELDEAAIKIARKNHPEIIHMGSVIGADFSQFYGADLLIGGSPCQGFSYMGDQLAFADPRSSLFFEFVRARDEIRPWRLLLENVRMKKEHLEVISSHLQCSPRLYNSVDVSAQNRPRYYWFNWQSPSLPQLNILLKDILEDTVDIKYNCPEKQLNRLVTSSDVPKAFSRINPAIAGCMTARQYANWKGTFVSNNTGGLRRLTPIECERLQNLPDNYTDGVSDSKRYAMLGNGWTVDVIAHILRSSGYATS